LNIEHPREIDLCRPRDLIPHSPVAEIDDHIAQIKVDEMNLWHGAIPLEK